jgi:hypothetical protein
MGGAQRYPSLPGTAAVLGFAALYPTYDWATLSGDDPIHLILSVKEFTPVLALILSIQ